MTDHEFSADIDITGLPQVEGWRWLWHTDYYDGPLSGMVLHEGENLWAAMVDECDHLVLGDDGMYTTRCGFYRRFCLIRLTPEAYTECVRQHELFREHVGTHWDYNDNGERVHALKPESQWHKFYDAIKERPAWRADGEPVATIVI